MGLNKALVLFETLNIYIGYYTVDCTIPKYILTIAQMTSILEEPIGEFNMVKLSGHESKYISVLYSQLYSYLFYYISKCHFKVTFYFFTGEN